ncbi:MAG: 23S rRNA (pseudouridine(1915)-N(3))-methyltransferase RlmH, partial [Ruminococcus sp.]|nr:23S rRNA (pseudouridine(1915)-N(3))-methyltransferase RlmH [Ruminococcus sp.]
MKINLIVIGKLKEEYLRNACGEYIKRLGRYCNIEIHELDECRLSDNPSEKEILSALKKEAAEIRKFASGMIIPLCIEGKQFTSEQFASEISSAGVN